MTNPPGDLDWRPTIQRPELVTAATRRAIAELDLDCFSAPIDAELADTAEFCKAYGVEPAESANCVIVEGRRGEVTTMAACMVLATDRADINKTVRKHLDVRKISFASMDSATDLTQMAHGGITPVGLPADWPVLVDRAVADSGWVVIGGGVRGSKIAIRGGDLASLPAAQVLELGLRYEG